MRTLENVQEPLIAANKIQDIHDSALFNDTTDQVELNEVEAQYYLLALNAMKNAVAYLKLVSASVRLRKETNTK